MNKQSRLNTLKNLRKFRTDVDRIYELAMSCDSDLLANTIRQIRLSYRPYDVRAKPIHERYAKCDYTGKLVPKDSLIEAISYDFEDVMVSEEAISSDFFRCPHCTRYHDKRNQGDFGMCTECSELHCLCYDCGSVVLTETTREVGGELICESCFDDNYFYCSDCGIAIHNDDAYDYRGEAYCQSCYEDIERDASDYIHDYSYKPYFPNYHSERRFGLEIEVEGDRDTAKELCEELREVYCKNDGSLNDGFEIVTNPLLFDDAIRIGKRIGDICRENGAKGDNGTCGIHVHVSRGGIKNESETVSKMLILMYRLKDTIERFARRSESRWAKVSYKTKSMYDSDPAGFIAEECRERYRAINLRNDKTIEFRIFKGTTNSRTIAAIVQFVNAFIDYCEQVDFNEIENVSWRDIFADKEGEEGYSELFDFMKSRRPSLWPRETPTQEEPVALEPCAEPLPF